VKSLLDRFDGLRLVWRHFPVPALHPRADLAAELAELAGLHGTFWDAHSLLTPRGRFSHDDLLSVAGRLELDPAETHAALREHTFRERVRADIEGGRRAEVHATPTSSSMASAWTGPAANSRRRAASPRHYEISGSVIHPAGSALARHRAAPIRSTARPGGA
jgi:hypothetical protein